MEALMLKAIICELFGQQAESLKEYTIVGSGQRFVKVTDVAKLSDCTEDYLRYIQSKVTTSLVESKIVVDYARYHAEEAAAEAQFNANHPELNP